MVEITEPDPRGLQVIQGYGAGGFRVSDREWRGAVLVLPDRTLCWAATALAELTPESFAPVQEADPPVELLIIGTGPRMALLPGDLRRALKALGLAIETMDTGAACRTYNVLLSEERRVAAALLPL